MSRSAWLAWSLVALGIILTVPAMVQLAREPATSFANWAFWFVILEYAVVGGFIASRRPANAIGWLFIGGPLAVLLGFAADAVAMMILPAPVATPITLAMTPVVQLGFMSLVIFIPMLFPDGRPPSPRWRAVMLVTVLGLVLIVMGQLFSEEKTLSGAPNPLVTWPPGEAIRLMYAIAEIPFFSFVLLAVIAALAVRYRRSHGVERLQLRWFLLVATLMATILIVTAVIPAITPIADVIGPLLFGALPVTVAVAILRHRLYDLELLINRTLVYTALTVSLISVYVALVIILQGILSGFTGGGGLAVAASTLAVAALFQPARRRIQSAVDRRFYRSRYDAQRTLEAFGARLRHQVDLTIVSEDLQSVVANALQPASVGVWLRAGTSR